MNADSAQYISSDQWVRSLQRNLCAAAKRSDSRRFGILYDKVQNFHVLQEAWRRVARNAGSCGVDGVSIKEIKEDGAVDFILDIQKELAAGNYQASAILRCYIDKGEHGKRPLGIPIVKDRVVQMAVKLVIEPLFEADFCECSYGFRPKRSNQQAAQLVHKLVNRHKWVVDLDLKSYFDTINHDLLMEFVRSRVNDRSVLRLIRQWLKAGIMEDGLVRPNERGAPQGGVLSPLLSNIFLNEFDRRWNENNGRLVRFADDMVILCDSPQQAEAALDLARRMLGRLHLKLNRRKTTLVHVREGFDFLGFTYKEAYSHGRRRLVRIKFPRSKSMKKARARIKERIKDVPLGESLEAAIQTLNHTLRGWAHYFRIGNSYEAARELTQYACQQLRLFLRRRRGRKDIVGSRRWPNRFFYEKGLEYVPSLL